MGEGVSSTIAARTSLAEQWNIINAREDRPSEKLAENARERRDLAQALVARLQALRIDHATRNAGASSYLEATITLWSAGVEEDEVLEQYALATVTWGAVLRARAAQSAAWASHTRARCDLWRLQGYSNAEDICDEVDSAERAG